MDLPNEELFNEIIAYIPPYLPDCKSLLTLLQCSRKIQRKVLPFPYVSFPYIVSLTVLDMFPTIRDMQVYGNHNVDLSPYIDRIISITTIDYLAAPALLHRTLTLHNILVTGPYNDILINKTRREVVINTEFDVSYLLHSLNIIGCKEGNINVYIFNWNCHSFAEYEGLTFYIDIGNQHYKQRGVKLLIGSNNKVNLDVSAHKDFFPQSRLTYIINDIKIIREIGILFDQEFNVSLNNKLVKYYMVTKRDEQETIGYRIPRKVRLVEDEERSALINYSQPQIHLPQPYPILPKLSSLYLNNK